MVSRIKWSKPGRYGDRWKGLGPLTLKIYPIPQYKLLVIDFSLRHFDLQNMFIETLKSWIAR